MTMRHHSWTRMLAGAAALAMLVAPLAACGNGNAGGSTQAGDIPAGGTDDGTQLTMWIRSSLERQAKNAVETYNKSHKNQVKLEVLPDNDLEGKVGGAAQTDSLPDLLPYDVVRIPYMASEGMFVDLTKQIDALPNKDDLQQGHIKAGTLDGKEYALPFVTDISVMVWNKNLYKEAGLDPEKGPTSIDEFVEQAKAVAALNKDGVSGSYLSGQGGGSMGFQTYPMIWASGGDVVNEDGTAATLDSKESQEAYAAWRELAETPNGLGAGSQQETGATWTAPFANGKIGVMPYPNTSTAAIMEAEKSGGFEVGVTAIPGKTEGSGSTFLGGDAITMTKDCKNQAQAWNFMAWLMTEEAQKAVFVDNGDTASNLVTLKNDYKDADPRIQTMNDVISKGVTPRSMNWYAAFQAAGCPMQILMQDLVWGDASKIAEDNQAITDVLAQ